MRARAIALVTMAATALVATGASAQSRDALPKPLAVLLDTARIEIETPEIEPLEIAPLRKRTPVKHGNAAEQSAGDRAKAAAGGPASATRDSLRVEGTGSQVAVRLPAIATAMSEPVHIDGRIRLFLTLPGPGTPVLPKTGEQSRIAFGTEQAGAVESILSANPASRIPVFGARPGVQTLVGTATDGRTAARLIANGLAAGVSAVAGAAWSGVRAATLETGRFASRTVRAAGPALAAGRDRLAGLLAKNGPVAGRTGGSVRARPDLIGAMLGLLLAALLARVAYRRHRRPALSNGASEATTADTDGAGMSRRYRSPWPRFAWARPSGAPAGQAGPAIPASLATWRAMHAAAITPPRLELLVPARGGAAGRLANFEVRPEPPPWPADTASRKTLRREPMVEAGSSHAPRDGAAVWAARTLAGNGMTAATIARRTGLARDAASLLVVSTRPNVPDPAASSPSLLAATAFGPVPVEVVI